MAQEGPLISGYLAAGVTAETHTISVLRVYWDLKAELSSVCVTSVKQEDPVLQR